MYTTEFGYGVSNEVNFAGWTVVSTESVSQEFGCSFYEDCPCCTCDADTVAKITLVQPRYSKSLKRIIEKYRTEFSCSAHVAEFAW